jgi:hypothetical protein
MFYALVGLLLFLELAVPILACVALGWPGFWFYTVPFLVIRAYLRKSP